MPRLRPGAAPATRRGRRAALLIVLDSSWSMLAAPAAAKRGGSAPWHRPDALAAAPRGRRRDRDDSRRSGRGTDRGSRARSTPRSTASRRPAATRPLWPRARRRRGPFPHRRRGRARRSTRPSSSIPFSSRADNVGDHGVRRAARARRPAPPTRPTSRSPISPGRAARARHADARRAVGDRSQRRHGGGRRAATGRSARRAAARARLRARVDAPENALAIDDEAFAWIERSRPLPSSSSARQPAWLRAAARGDPACAPTFSTPANYRALATRISSSSIAGRRRAAGHAGALHRPAGESRGSRAPDRLEATPAMGSAPAAHPVVPGVDPVDVDDRTGARLSRRRLAPVARSARGTPLVYVGDARAPRGPRRVRAGRFEPGLGARLPRADWQRPRLARAALATPGAAPPRPRRIRRGVPRVTGPRGVGVPLTHMPRRARRRAARRRASTSREGGGARDDVRGQRRRSRKSRTCRDTTLDGGTPRERGRAAGGISPRSPGGSTSIALCLCAGPRSSGGPWQRRITVLMRSSSWTVSAAFLWLLLAMPLVWVAHLRARTNFNPRQRRLQAGLRSLLLRALALALARPVISTHVIARVRRLRRRRVAQRRRAPPSTRRRADRRDQRGAPPRITRASSHSARTPRSLDRHAGAAAAGAARARARRRPSSIARGTDLEARARRRARASSRPDTCRASCCSATGTRRLATRGRDRPPRGGADPGVRRAAGARDARRHVDRLDRRPGAPRRRGAVHGDGRRRQPARQPRRSSNCDPAGRCSRRGTAVLPARHHPRAHRSGARGAGRRPCSRRPITLPGDPLAAQQHAQPRRLGAPARRKCSTSRAPRRVRVISSSALEESGFDVTVRPAAGLPTTAAEFEPWDVVVLSDVSRSGDSRRERWRRWPSGSSSAAAACWSPAANPCSAKGGYRKIADRAADAGHLRAEGRARSGARAGARSIVEHGRHLDGPVQGGGAGGGRRDGRRAVVGILTFNDELQLGRHAPQRRQEPRRDPQAHRRDRPGRPHADLSRRSSRRTAR